MNKEPARNPAPPDDELVAYLDGELDAEGGRRVEALLATDPKLRRRLQSLERTWDLLDELDTAAVGEPFTHSTLEMVAVAAGEEIERGRSEAPRRRLKRLAACLAIVVAAAAAGFASVALLAPDADRQLLEDLPLLARFDEYRYAESVGFLRLLRAEGLFSGPDADPPGDAKAAADYSGVPIGQRRRLVADMDPEEKEQLRLAAERFRNLAPEERQRIRRLHEELLDAPDADQLEPIVRRYFDWLKTLTPFSRTGLAEMDPKDRALWIKKRLEAERRRQGGWRLGDDDLMKLRKWAFEYAAKHEKQFIETFSEEERKNLSELRNPRTQRWVVFERMMQQWRSADPQKPLPMMNDGELENLRGQLSLRARRRLESAPPAMQWKMAAGWLMQGPHRPAAFDAPRGASAGDDDERLARFFETELNGEQRDWLLSLPPEEMQRELHRLFLMHAGGRKGPHRRNGGLKGGNWSQPQQPTTK